MNKKIIKAASEDVLAQLNAGYPAEKSNLRIQLPRLSMVSQDVTEGKGKAMKVVSEAGTFFIENQTDEVDENGKKEKVWHKEELGDSIEGIILYKRKQLRLYDEATSAYTSSPIYDTDDEVVRLFSNKKEVARGTPKELQAKYMVKDKDNKDRSKLEENRILYVMYKGEIYQMNLRGSSMYSLMSYERKGSPSQVLTRFGSTTESKGSIEWNKMSFDIVRGLDQEEALEVLKEQNKIRSAIAIEKESYASKKSLPSKKEKDDELDEMADEASKLLE